MQDLRLDARDPKLNMSYIDGANALKQRIDEVMRLAVIEAQAFWSVASTVDTLPASCEWAAQYYARHDGLAFDNYAQHAMARPFILAKNRRGDEARALLEKFIDSNRSSLRDKTAECLRTLLSKAETSVES